MPITALSASPEGPQAPRFRYPARRELAVLTTRRDAARRSPFRALLRPTRASVTHIGRETIADPYMAVYAAAGPLVIAVAFKTSDALLRHAPAPAFNTALSRGRLHAAPLRAAAV